MKIQREKPDFKAVDWVRKVRNKNYELTHGMTAKERITFYRDGSKRLRAKLARSRRTARRPALASS